jgi:hypothetical protein
MNPFQNAGSMNRETWMSHNPSDNRGMPPARIVPVPQPSPAPAPAPVPSNK